MFGVLPREIYVHVVPLGQNTQIEKKISLSVLKDILWSPFIDVCYSTIITYIDFYLGMPRNLDVSQSI